MSFHLALHRALVTRRPFPMALEASAYPQGQPSQQTPPDNQRRVDPIGACVFQPSYRLTGPFIGRVDLGGVVDQAGVVALDGRITPPRADRAAHAVMGDDAALAEILPAATDLATARAHAAISSRRRSAWLTGTKRRVWNWMISVKRPLAL